MNLNIKDWKEYKLSDIFILKGGFYNKKPEHSIDGDVPFLASTESNNGVTEYYSLEDIKIWDKVGNIDNTIDKKIFKGNCIAVTVNGSVCNAFYQTSNFTCSHDITVLYAKNHELTCNQALFVCSVIMKEKYRWSYGRKPHDVKKFGKSTIKLPSLNEQPDWEFMENYIKSINYKPITTKNMMRKSPILETTYWKEYQLGQLFNEIYKAEAHVKNDIDNFEYENNNRLEFVTRTDTNNGCDCFVNKSDVRGIEKGNAIIIGDTTSTFYYQANNFVAGDHIVVCRANWINKYTALFLKAILEKERYRYSYGRAFKMDLIKSTFIKLPTKNNLPDWEFMENYIKSLPYGDRIWITSFYVINSPPWTLRVRAK